MQVRFQYKFLLLVANGYQSSYLNWYNSAYSTNTIYIFTCQRFRKLATEIGGHLCHTLRFMSNILILSYHSHTSHATVRFKTNTSTFYEHLSSALSAKNIGVKNSVDKIFSGKVSVNFSTFGEFVCRWNS